MKADPIVAGSGLEGIHDPVSCRKYWGQAPPAHRGRLAVKLGIRATGLGLVLLLAGCAGDVPEPIRTDLPDSPQLKEVRQDPAAFVGERVRWGGTIAEVQNRQEVTRIQLVARGLNGRGKPRREGSSAGRFLAEVEGFLDPAVYAEERLLTVVGRLQEPETQPIGDYAYQFPVVRVDSHHLWPQPDPIQAPGYYGGPYGDPWYRFHPYGHRIHPHHFRHW